VRDRALNAVEIIHDSVSRFGPRVLLSESAQDGGSTAGSRHTTYAEIGALAASLAEGLYATGLKRGARVAVLLENSAELVVSEWACLISGLVWVGLNVRTSAAELQRLVDDSAPSVLFYGPRFRELAEAVQLPEASSRILAAPDGVEWLRLLGGGLDASRVGRALVPPGPAEPVRIRYTSGTAGTPKGAVLPRRCYDASVGSVSDVVGPLRSDDVVVHVAPMTHASGALLLPHAAVGARSVVLRHFDAYELIDVVERERATAVFLVPTMLVRLLEAIEDSSRLKSLRTIVYGGASMPLDRLRLGLELLGPIFVQIYGLTESTWPVCALLREDHVRREREPESMWLRRLQSCGRATNVGTIRIVDPDGTEVRPGQVGELWVRGRNTMSGYWRLHNHPAVHDTKGIDAEGWMHTGDVGFRDGEGFVTIVDRLHDMIVSGGFNVYPREVEGALSGHDAVLEAAVVGRPDAEWGETVHAAVVLRPGRCASVDDLMRHCAAILPGYKKPRSIEIVEALPKNPSGKILRRAIRDRLSP
jgi:acyl-CoA synthetase (AMP-forming)/AMP-acid ligase II